MQLKNKLTKQDRARIKQRQQDMQMVLVKRTIAKDGSGNKKVFLDRIRARYEIQNINIYIRILNILF